MVSLGKLDNIVALIFAANGEDCAIQTLTTFAEAAHYPASLWVSVSQKSPVHALVQVTGRFSLAVLSQRHIDTARRFLRPATGHEAIRHVATYETRLGFVLPRDSLASTGCEVTQAVDLHGHTMFFADIVESYYDSRHSHVRQLLSSDLDVI